jgi:carbonic anhydrase
VAWNVLATPATASQAQIDGFRYNHNARPVQPLGDRLVLADKS